MGDTYCPKCGEEVSTTYSYDGYCSYSCMSSYKNQEYCANCNKELPGYSSWGKFCSYSCELSGNCKGVYNEEDE